MFPIFIQKVIFIRTYFANSETSRFLFMIIWTMDSDRSRKCGSWKTASALVSMKARIMLTSSEADV